jgi:hypothetical protein
LAALFYSIVKFVEYDTERAELHLRLRLSRDNNSVEVHVEDGDESREKDGTRSDRHSVGGRMRDHESTGGTDMV